MYGRLGRLGRWWRGRRCEGCGSRAAGVAVLIEGDPAFAGREGAGLVFQGPFADVRWACSRCLTAFRDRVRDGRAAGDWAAGRGVFPKG